MTGIAWCIVMQPVSAEIREPGAEGAVGDRLLETDIPYLSEIEPPLTTVEAWATELAQSTTIQIVGVQLNETETGIEIIFNTTDGQLAIPTPSVVGNALIADIPNAVLSLPEGDDFQSADPAPGITLVTVSSLSNERVRVAITGSEAPPIADISTEPQNLILTISAGEPSETQRAGIEDGFDNDAIQIVVTAERAEENIQDVPISVTALTQEDIEDADITSLPEIAANTPNFSVFSGAGQDRSFSNYSVRGLGNVNFFSSDTVGFYVDDVPIDTTLGTAFLNLNLIDLERIEVLRGPQNTLYGRNTQAGAVNIITRQPSNNFESNSIIDYGRFDDLNIRTSISGPVVKDRLFARLSGSFASRDGYLENTFLDSDVDEQSGWTGRAQLLWTPSDDWNISFNASVDDYNDGAVPFVLLDQPDPFETERDFDGFNNLNTNTQSLRVAYSNPDLRVTSITARRFARTDQNSDGDGTVLDLFQVPLQIDSTVWTQELRLQSPDNDGPLEWLAGGYFEARDAENIDDGLIFGEDAFNIFGVPPGTDVSNGDVETTIFGIFGQVSYQPIEPLTLTAGLRYENTNATLESLERTFTPQGGDAITTFSASDVEQTSNAVLPRFVAQYRFNPNIMAYGSVSRGFKPAGVNPRANSDVTLTFEEERSWNFELGVRSSWLNNRLAANVTVFHNPISDFQVVTFDGFSGLPLEIENADARTTGFELEVRATPLEGLDLIAGFGLADARFTDFPDSDGGESVDGNRIPFAPEFTYNLAAQYRSPIGLLGRLELQGLGTTFFDENNTLSQGSFALVNARLGYEFENYGIYLFANNIFDVEYLTFISPPIGGNSLALFGTPATYGVQLKASF